MTKRPRKDENDRLREGTLPLDPFEDTEPMGAPSPKKKGPVTHEQTDLGNAERFVSMHTGLARYVAPWKKWLVYDGKRWIVDGNNAALRLARDTARALLAEAHAKHAQAVDAQAASLEQHNASVEEAKPAQQSRRVRGRVNATQQRIKWAIKSQNASKIRSMLELACSFPELATTPDDLDANPWLLNVENGTLDLETGKLAPHRQSDLCTKLAPVRYDARATCPTWEAFLSRAMSGDAEMLGFVQRMVGYALTGVIREQVLGFLFGGGANGKSTFFTLVRAMLGDYAVTAPRGLLFRSRFERHPTELTTLFRARFVTCAEIEEGQAFDEGLVKDLTGGEEVSARRMNENFWTFAPTHKLFLAGNHRPVVKGDDDGIWRRIRLIPWLVTIPPEERDSALPEKLRAELPGILAWAVRGCLEWQKRGLGEPVEVTRATEAYRKDSDVLGEFLHKRCIFVADARIPRKELRQAYEAWCEDEGRSPVGPRRLAERLRRERVTETTMRTPTSATPVDAWRGIRLLTPMERERMAEEASDGK